MSGIDFLYGENTLQNCTDFEGNRVDIPYDKHSTPVSNFTKYTYLYKYNIKININLNIVLIIVK